MAKRKIPKKRLFVSIDIPADIKTLLKIISKDLKKKNLIEGRWVKEDMLHITLQFLGYIPTDLIEPIQAALQHIPFEPFRVTLGPLGVNDITNPRVLWIEVHSPMLNWLAQEIKAVLSPFIEPEERSFHGHITLARIKKVHNQEGLAQMINSYTISNASWPVEHFSLMESILNKKESHYCVIKVFNAE
jgi:RNA 2',3'-cyclic 3'-phosphodiesterase